MSKRRAAASRPARGHAMGSMTVDERSGGPLVEFVILSDCRHIRRVRTEEPTSSQQWCDLCRRFVVLESAATVISAGERRLVEA